MSGAATLAQTSLAGEVIVSALMFAGSAAAVYVGYAPLKAVIRQRERRYDDVLRRGLLIDISPRTVTVLTGVVMVILAMIGWMIAGGLLGALVAMIAGAFVPEIGVRYLATRRVRRLENQLVGGVQTLASGVRAGLNLVQSMELVARDGAAPLRQEFAHLLREYEYGAPLEEAMNNAATRIGSPDFRLLFSALETHRERGGDLGATLDRIADSIREIQRLEGRVRSLTAQGRANARFMTILVGIVMVVLYMIEPDSVKLLFVDNLGKVLLMGIAALIVIGFVWIRRIVSIDI